MADFLTAVKSVHKKAADEQPEAALTEISSQTAARETSEPAAKAISQKNREKITSTSIRLTVTPEDALQLFRSEPDTESLLATLKKLRAQDGFSNGFDIRAAGSLQAQILHSLVATVIPTFWAVLNKEDKDLAVSCLRNVAGTNAVVARIRLLCDSHSQSSGSGQELLDLLEALQLMLNGEEYVSIVWSGLVEAVTNNVKRSMLWKEAISLLGSGKVIATVARSEDLLKENDTIVKKIWLSSGAEYSAWLGRNIATLYEKSSTDDSLRVKAAKAAADLLAKSLGIGYPIALIRGVSLPFINRAMRESQEHSGLGGLLGALPSFSKRQYVETTVRWLLTVCDSDHLPMSENLTKQKAETSAVAAVLSLLLRSDDSFNQVLLDFLGDPVQLSTVTFAIRRSCIAVMAVVAPDELQSLLERLMAAFGDTVFINHAPVLQQESVAQALLMTAGYLHRANPIAVLMTARSSNHMQGVSNRLDSSNTKARWLGMIVGTALSSLVDKEGSKMSFGTEEMQTDEARWYLDLVQLNDPIGTLVDFDNLLKRNEATSKPKKKPQKLRTETLPVVNGKQTFGPPRPPIPAQTGVVGEKVSEILDDEDDEDVDLKPYAKPDSDPEDSDEDATLVNRNKPRPPAYIRDLMRMLKGDQNHDRFQMAIKHAPALIRRKANFGGEVRDHAEELALMMCDLQDPFQTEKFDELKLQTLIAILLSDINTLAPWLSKQAFTGDYSLSQRCIMLSALGLGGRELAGFKEQDDLNPTLPENATSFPSKRLPSHLHAVYTPTDRSVRRLESASKNIEHQLIKPLALSAADETTSHLNAVKVRTFSSRMDVERTKRKPAANQLAKIFGPAFFFPLVSRYQQEVAAYGQSSVFMSAPFVLVTFIKTLALLLHASGPATMNLAVITTAFWDLLLSLRVKAISDISILEAVLFSLLTLLEMNSDSKQRIAQETPKQLMETQQWVELVFERTGGGELVTEGSDDETRVRTLSAGVLVKTREIIEAYQKMLIGNTYG